MLISARAPTPFRPVCAMVRHPIALPYSTAWNTLPGFPDPADRDHHIPLPPAVPRPFHNTQPTSLEYAVRVGRESVRNRACRLKLAPLVKALAKCDAALALPPFPQAKMCRPSSRAEANNSIALGLCSPAT